ncbi:MBL fold metallo-hydrolase [Arthrobacter sp. CAN_C5]|uniref:MBL fold metallo-hydrolase n=1 Tax=Arthrobacter sp. CAN_C5 TaxID=2760706 RepID=UPI001AE71B12|nr:MBL fold metallo-hydrolase [Arthrobacter sp. CAN_C5]MBP2217079.1 L-ascorbate metabolism protein UlaG (beta-lactamase superfamily) [Arthrobacter sp. CAN_C5]
MSTLDVTIVGGPTAVFSLTGITFMTDPTFDLPRNYPSPGRPTLVKTTAPAMRAPDLPHPDVVLLSHDEHVDNFDEAGRELAARVATVLSTPEAAGRIPWVAGLQAWQTVDVTGAEGQVVHITGVPARHGPEGCEPFTGTVTGFVLHGESLPTVYVSGDNSSVDLVKEIAERFPNIDVAILFAGGGRLGPRVFNNAEITFTGETAAQSAMVLAGAQVVPVHVEGWAHLSEDVGAVRTAFAAADLEGRLHVACPGETVTIEVPAR